MRHLAMIGTPLPAQQGQYHRNGVPITVAPRWLGWPPGLGRVLDRDAEPFPTCTVSATV